MLRVVELRPSLPYANEGGKISEIGITEGCKGQFCVGDDFEVGGQALKIIAVSLYESPLVYLISPNGKIISQTLP